jgi:hypothetical protein
MDRAQEEHNARVEDLIGSALTGKITYKVQIGKEEIKVDTPLTLDKARLACTRTNTDARARAREGTSRCRFSNTRWTRTR